MLDDNQIPLACSSWDDNERRAFDDVVKPGIFTMGSQSCRNLKKVLQNIMIQNIV